MSKRRPLPPLLLTPRYCVTLAGQRWLELGVFASRADAESRVDRIRAAHHTLPPAAFAVEPIFISRKSL